MTGIVERIRSELILNRARGIDVLYNEVDDLLLASKFDEANAALLEIAESNLPLSILLSALVVSHSWSMQTLHARNELKKKAKRVAYEIGGDEKVKEIAHHL